ncbi:hypothetical protein AB0C27_53790 [Nonomuraea sp. NPDC048882]|uniref:winged helix-turn-helix domain-containing protein n=1 Tax=Nonomuraea sp. NPDC048882 TaxID=3154347 RepID=UPI0033E3A17B
MSVADQCPIPPHRDHATPADPADPAGQQAPEAGPAEGHVEPSALWVATKATWRWFRAAPAERTPLLGGAALYGAGALVHAYHLPWWGIGLATVAGSIATYASATNRLTGWRVGGATTATAASGVWLASGAELGVTAGPSALATWLFVGTFGVGYGLHRLGLRRRPQEADEPQIEVVAPEVPRISWESYLAGWGLDGASVVKAEPTRLGERVLLDTRGTGKLASAFNARALEEQIAQDFGLAVGRVEVRRGGIAGQMRISVRLKDPWAQPIAHPMLDMTSEVRLVEVEDARKPLIVGQDPETGRPLGFTVWDEDGAAHWMVVAIKGGGKTVLLNNVLERLTAADNVAVWGIDVSKGKDLRRWRDAGALGPTACGASERAKAVRILELAVKTIKWREAHSNEAVFQPRPGHPLIEVVIDEVDALVAGGDQLGQRASAALTYITSKGRSASVGCILVGQRGTAAWMGGANIRANIDRFALLKVGRGNEVRNAVGEMGIALPDIASYGEGKPGVVLFTDIAGAYEVGRTFKLKDLEDIEALAAGRAPSEIEPDLLAHLGTGYTQLASIDDQAAAPVAGQAAAEEPEQDVVRSPEERAAELAQLRGHLMLLPPLTADDAARVREHSAARWELFHRVEAEAEASLSSTVPADAREAILGRLADGEAARQELATAAGYSPAAIKRFMTQLRQEKVVDCHGRGPATRWYLVGDEHVA